MQAGIDRRYEPAPVDRKRVERTVHVGAFDGAVGVGRLDLDALAAAKFDLVCRLYAADAYVVAGRIVGPALDVALADLADIAQQVSADLAGVLPRRAEYRIEPLEVAFVECQLGLLRHIVGHEKGRPRIASRLVDLRAQTLGRDVEYGRHAHRVETLVGYLARDDHDVVALAALHQILAASVEHLAARGVLHHAPDDVRRSQILVFGVDQLDVAQTQRQRDEYRRDYPAQRRIALKRSPFEFHCPEDSLDMNHAAPGQTSARASALPANMRPAVCQKNVNDMVSRKKNIAW